MCLTADMRKVVAMQPLDAEMLMDCGNVIGLHGFYACSTEFFSNTVLKVEILWKFYLFYTNCSFKCTIEPFSRYFH